MSSSSERPPGYGVISSWAVGAYDIVRPLGQGGMGTVYVAVQKELGREVALKLLPRTAATDPALVARFQREMKLIGGLAHPNIVRVFDWGQIEDQLYYAMELFRGHDLSKEKPGDFARARALLDQAADAIAYLHERQLFHRDIKPSNFVVVEPAHLTLIDFGLARLKEGTLLTEDGAVVGTLRFLPPEAVQGGPAEAPGDVYALAATAHELISGKPLIPPGSLPEMVARIVSTQRPQLSGVPPAFAELQTRALAVDPAARPTAVQYRDALRALADASGGAVKATRSIPTPAPRPVAERTPRTAVPAEPTAPGRLRVLYAALAVCLAVNVALAAALLRRAPEAPPAPPAPAPSVAPPSPTSPALAAPTRKAPGLRADWLARTPPEVSPAVAAAVVRVVRSLRCFPTERGAYVDLDHGTLGGAALEVGRWDDGHVLFQQPPVAGNCVQVMVEGLEPDTDHFLRLSLPSGELVLHDYRFRTLPRSHRREVELLTITPDRTQAHLERAFAAALQHPDLRYARAALSHLESVPPGEALGLSAISALARTMRWGTLAHAVLRHTSRLTGTALESEGIRTAIACRVPNISTLDQFPETKDPHLFEGGRELAIYEPAGFERLLRAIRMNRIPYDAGHDLAFNSPARVLAAARNFEKESFEVRAALAIALHDLATDEAAALLDLRTKHTDIPVANLGHLLAAMNTPVARASVLEELERAGDSEDGALAMLAPLQRSGPFDRIAAIVKLAKSPSAVVRREALGALVASGSADAIPVFAAALADPHGEVASTAAWALGFRAKSIPAAAAGFIPTLRGLCRAQQNITGLAWWALARVEGARVVPELEAELERAPRVTDTMGIAWSLAELGATSALPALERVAAAADRARPARDLCRFAADLLAGRTSPPDGARFITFPAGLGTLRTGIVLAPGQSVEIAQRGWWAFHPDPLTPVDGYEPGELAIVPFVGAPPSPLSFGPKRLIANRRIDLTISGLGGLAVPQWLKSRKPAIGFAILTVSP
jgi:predicted Ser/Thr protein kinase